MVDLLAKLGLAERDDGGEFALLRQNRGRLLRRPLAGGTEIIASGRDVWIGWVEHKTEPVNELAMQHTAMVIRDVAGDVQAVVEADNTTALKKFSGIALEAIGGQPFEHVMLIDGNDDRGIDVALMTRSGYEIVAIASHVDDTDAQGEIFSRDCPEYTVALAADGERLVLLVNDLKSKGFGSQSSSNKKRRRQARRVAQIYRRLTAEGQAQRHRPRRLQRHSRLRAARSTARSDRPSRHHHPSELHERRQTGHIRKRHQEQQDRLHPSPGRLRLRAIMPRSTQTSASASPVENAGHLAAGHAGQRGTIGEDSG